MRAILLAISAYLVSASAANHHIYNGYSVFGVHLRDISDQRLLMDLGAKLNIDIWNHGAIEVRDALVMVSPENKQEFVDTLSEKNLKHYLHLPDVARYFYLTMPAMWQINGGSFMAIFHSFIAHYITVPFIFTYRSLKESELDLQRWQLSRSSRLAPFTSYPRYAEVDQYIERIASQYPNLVTLVNAGPSFEGRPVKYLKISTTNFTNTSKPVYYLDAAMHAREWVTVPVALYVIHRLVEDLREEDRDLLENIDWIVNPIVNPDGYEYTHTDNRLWRRTRSYNPEVSTECWGVDANRNFDSSFNTIGVSSNPCSDVYPGSQAFSEPETRYVRDIIQENVSRMQIYQNIHSFGNYVLFGYGNGTLPENAAELHLVGAAMGAAIDAKKLDKVGYYLVGNSNLALYGTSGSAQDWAQEAGVPLSYTLELPGYEYDFRVPPQYIDQINKETWDGIVVTARIANLQYRSRINNN